MNPAKFQQMWPSGLGEEIVLRIVDARTHAQKARTHGRWTMDNGSSQNTLQRFIKLVL